jgi:hypothetical protein
VFFQESEHQGSPPMGMSLLPWRKGRSGTGTSALAALAVVAILTVVELHGRGGRAVLDAAQAKSAASSLTVYDSAVGRSVLEAEREVDTLFVQLSKAQTHLNHLANKVLEGAKPGKASKLARPLAAGTKLHQSAHVVHVEEALDQSIAEAKANVDRLSHALRDAEAKLNTQVAFIVDAHPADRKKLPAGVQGPPIALAHKARASQLAEQPPVAASGDKAGFPSHAAERRNVRAAYRKFFKLKGAKEDAAKAKEAKEASEGVDVTPYSDCKGTACHVQIYMNLQTPTVDYTALTGKHYLPSLRKLRKTVRERGRLSLEDTRQAVEKKPNEQPFKFEWQRPGAEHVEIGGEKRNGKRCDEPPVSVRACLVRGYRTEFAVRFARRRALTRPHLHVLILAQDWRAHRDPCQRQAPKDARRHGVRRAALGCEPRRASRQKQDR